MSNQINVGKCLRIAQEKTGVRNSQLADKMGVAVQQVSRWRNRDDMTVQKVSELASCLDMTVGEFLELGS